ncbi:MAG: hypothetical protein OEN02_00140, partial [Gammaproteobacteria bacterium]|nr:hypothetical protein [Gammaproteobacteria bacterium]
MTRNYLTLIVLTCVLSACASTQSRENSRLNRQSIDDALNEAAAVVIPDAEVPPAEILDELMPGSGISVPGLEQDV